jgi:hypothetical protein
MEAERSSKTSVNIYQTIRRHISDDSNHTGHCYEKLKSHKAGYYMMKWFADSVLGFMDSVSTIVNHR